MGILKGFTKWYREADAKSKANIQKRKEDMQARKDKMQNKKEDKLATIEAEFKEKYEISVPIEHSQLIAVTSTRASLYTAVEKLDYIGGSPLIEPIFSGKLTGVCVLNEYLLVRAGGTIIDFKNIKSIRLATEEEISKNVTLTRMLAFGVYSLAMKKKKRTINSCLVVDIDNNGLGYTIAFGGDNKKVHNVYSTLFKKLSAYRTISNLKDEA